jgi:SAM-dependent methyltransferase
MNNQFIDIKFSRNSMHNYWARRSIHEAIKENLTNFSGNLLDTGCGAMPYKEYVLENSAVENYLGLDIEGALSYDNSIKPDFLWDGITMPFESNSFDCCIATEVLEHCPEPKLFLSEVQRVIKNDGTFFFTVPFLWNLHEVPHDEFRYTPFSLTRMLEESGFREIKIHATGGWNAAMAQMLGLYVTRGVNGRFKKRALQYLALPLMKRLHKLDQKAKKSFDEGQMITGLYGTCKK